MWPILTPVTRSNVNKHMFPQTLLFTSDTEQNRMICMWKVLASNVCCYSPPPPARPLSQFRWLLRQVQWVPCYYRNYGARDQDAVGHGVRISRALISLIHVGTSWSHHHHKLHGLYPIGPFLPLNLVRPSIHRSSIASTYFLVDGIAQPV